jgi:hypothetical protein
MNPLEVWAWRRVLLSIHLSKPYVTCVRMQATLCHHYNGKMTTRGRLLTFNSTNIQVSCFFLCSFGFIFLLNLCLDSIMGWKLLGYDHSPLTIREDP